MRIAIALALLCVSARAEAQTWADLQRVPRETPVRVFEVSGKDWTFADGKLLLVKDDELTILISGRPIVIPKPVISRIQTRRRDPPIEGALIGALVSVLLGVRGGWQGCPDSSCIALGISAHSALGALIDWQIREKKTVYRAP